MKTVSLSRVFRWAVSVHGSCSVRSRISSPAVLLSAAAVFPGVLILYVLFLLAPVVQTIVPIDLIADLFESSALSGVFASDGFFIRVVTGR